MPAIRSTSVTEERIIRAVVVDDERLLAEALVRELRQCWPELSVTKTLSDGESALRYVLEERPDIAFLDIRMPRLSGLEVASFINDAWMPEEYGRPPLIVFVTAYSEFAVEAFDQAAVDYLVKPIVPERLAETVSRAQAHLFRAM